MAKKTAAKQESAAKPPTWEPVAHGTTRLAIPGGALYRTCSTVSRGGHVVACSESLAFVPSSD